VPVKNKKQYAEHFQFQKLWQFLMGLNETYTHAKSQIRMIVHVPNVNQVYAMIINVQSQRLNGGSSGSSLANSHSEVALMSNKLSQGQYSGSSSSHHGNSSGSNSGFGGINAYGSGNGSNGGYRQRNYGDGQPNGKSHLYCDFCHYKVHTRESCYKFHDYVKKKGVASTPHVNNAATWGNHSLRLEYMIPM